MNELIMSERLIDMLVQHEGVRLHPYKCTSNKLTIGIGRNLDDKGISQDEAYTLLFNDIRDAYTDLERVVDVRTLSENRLHAFIDMMFNLGLPRFMSFRRMLKAVREEDWFQAAEEMMDSRWARQVGNRAKTLALMVRDG